ncbi:MAG: tetratricopeptide repeat protein, partial [Chloroflexi bacterium]|nr:tetratricopeptide repeat protein [Chloroflexota bacterium]
MLQTAPLLTLVGVGGVGKTRLALRAAAAARERYAHGAWLVELARVTDPSEVTLELARTLGVRERPGASPLETLRAALRARQLLLVLDNCEHVVAACAEAAASLLQTCPNLSILATSREALGAVGEKVYLVPPFPAASVRGPTAACLENEAIDLFVDRARAIEPAFELTPQAAASVARICTLVDGLPLAIELAAARTTTMSPAEIAVRLDDPLRLLTRGARSVPARQQTLGATIEWSYQLLTASEQTLLRRLAIFQGGFTRDAATSVCSDVDLCAGWIDDLLDRLAAQSLLVSVKQHEHTRFHLLEMVRQYCWARLEDAGEVMLVRERHRDWCLTLVGEVAIESRLGLALDAELAKRLEPDMDNVRSALRWTIDTAQGDAAARLAVAVTSSCFFHGNFSESRSWASAVLDCGTSVCSTPEMAQIGTAAGIMAFNQGDFSGAEALLTRALDLARASNDDYAEMFTESRLGRLAHQRGDLSKAMELLERSLDRLVGLGNPWQAVVVVMSDLVLTCLELGDTPRAAELLRAVTDLATPERSPFMSARFLTTQARLAEREGDLHRAVELLAGAVDAQQANDDQVGVLESIIVRSTIAIRCGDRTLAAGLLRDALDLAESFGSKIRLARLLEAVAALLVEWQPKACVRMAAAAEQLRTTLRAVPFPDEQARMGHHLQIARQRLGHRVYGDTWAAAPSITLETTLVDARQLILAFEAGRPAETPAARSDPQCAVSARAGSGDPGHPRIEQSRDCHGASCHEQDRRSPRGPHIEQAGIYQTGANRNLGNAPRIVDNRTSL